MSNKTKHIPISAAKDIAKKYGYDQIIIVGRKTGDSEDACEHVTTYGINKVHCKIAADIGNYLKYEIMKWGRKVE